MFASALKAVKFILDPVFAGIVFKALGLTILLFALLAFGAEAGLHHINVPPAVRTALEWLAPLLFLLLALFLGAPVAAIFASLFLDRIARGIEARYYPADAPAPGTGFWAGLGSGLNLAGLVIAANLGLLPFDFALPGLAEIATLLVNGWLLGREYFELAAFRHMSRGAANGLRRRHRTGIFGAGVMIAFLAMVPLVNFFAPLFAAAFMVHLFKFYWHEERQV